MALMRSVPAAALAGAGYGNAMQWLNAAKPSNGGYSLAAPSTPSPLSVTDPFRQALAALSGSNSDVEKMYQQGKRRTLSDIAMQSVNAGMANTLNMPAAGVAYDEANRPATNVAVASQKANLLGELGRTMAGVYGTDVGAKTSLSNASLAAGTDIQTTQMGIDLKKYLAQLEAKAVAGSGGFRASSMSQLFG